MGDVDLPAFALMLFVESDVTERLQTVKFTDVHTTAFGRAAIKESVKVDEA